MTEADTCRAYLDGLPPGGDLRREPRKVHPAQERQDRRDRQVAQLRATQEETRKELEALMLSILDKAFKGEL
jgi:hypothetical protein